MKEARKTRKNKLSLILIYLGILVISGTIAREAYFYPWATVFGGVSQDDAALPDPPPIVWENGDREVSAPSASSSVYTVLPGNEAQKDGKPSQYAELGIIKIPKLNLSQHILEGTQGQLHYGVGHVAGTAAIGQPGNCALAGHNTTSFRYLDKLSADDRVILKAGGNVFTYSVYNSFTVLPADTDVLKNIRGEISALTMITCTPYLTGTHRLIIQARLVEVNGLPHTVSSGPSPGYTESTT